MENLAKGNWTDPERVQEFAKTYSRRYGEEFWTALAGLLPEVYHPRLGDFGCGPGIWLADAVIRLHLSKAYGFDASQAMLDYAEEVLATLVAGVPYELHQVDFDKDQIPIATDALDLAFGGYMLHEVADADMFLASLSEHIRKDGACIIFDYVSGDAKEFVRQMVERGMSEHRARQRYPHMCKHSVEDIKGKMRNSGFSSIRFVKIRLTRAIIVGIKG